MKHTSHWRKCYLHNNCFKLNREQHPNSSPTLSFFFRNKQAYNMAIPQPTMMATTTTDTSVGLTIIVTKLLHINTFIAIPENAIPIKFPYYSLNR